MALALDRKAFIDILSEGKDDLAGVMLPPPDGKWGMRPEVLKALPGFQGDKARCLDADQRERSRRPESS